MAHLSIHWDTENGIKPTNKTCQYINDAMDYVSGVRYFLGDDTPDVIIMLHTDNHDDKPTVYMTIGGDGVPTLESEIWFPTNQEGLERVGDVEFKDYTGEWHHFTVFKNKYHYVFGGVCNTGLLESGSFLIDTVFSDDENLQALIEEIEGFYIGGNTPMNYDGRFVCNDRM